MMQANWNSLGKPTVPLKSSPSTAQNTDGRLEVFSAGSDGALWHLWQTSADTPWSGWSSLNKPANTSLLVTAGIGKNADGRLEVFVIGSDGALWHNWQTAPEQGPWFNWFSSGRPSASIGNAQFPPSLAQNVDGRLEAFTVGTDGALWHIYQVAPNGIWSGWAPLGTPPNVHAVTVPIVGQNADGRLEVFTIGSDGALWHIWQTRPGQGPWSNWFSSGRPAASVSNTSPALAVSQNLDGRLEVFTVGSDGALWHLWQSRPNGTWSTWASLGFPTGASIPSPLLWGRIEMDASRCWPAATTGRSGTSGKRHPEKGGALGTPWARRPLARSTLPLLWQRMPMDALRPLLLVLMGPCGIAGKWRRADHGGVAHPQMGQ